MPWYRTPDSLGRLAMSDLLPTNFPPVFFCGPSVLASQSSAVSRRGSIGLHVPASSVDMALAWPGRRPHPVSASLHTRHGASHSSAIFARCVQLGSMATCPCPPSTATAVAVVAQTPVRRSAVQTRGLEQRASRTRHSFQSELHHAQWPTTSTSPLPLLLGFSVSWTCWLPNLSSVFLHC